MRLRFFLLVALVATLSWARAGAQSPATQPVLALTPSVGALTTVHSALLSNAPAHAEVTFVLFDPAGNQLVEQITTNDAGAVATDFRPPAGLWQAGVYRLVAGFALHQSVSATFVAGDGQTHLYAGPDLTSPYSAFLIQGSGYRPGSVVDLTLDLASGLGSRYLQATVDASGVFTEFVWPEEEGFPFWSAGRYDVQSPSTSLTASFFVRERPNGPTISVPNPVLAGAQSTVVFQHYAAGRYLWGVYADAKGTVLGEFLQGPTTSSGQVVGTVYVPSVPSGVYRLATPYDWGEITFRVESPTATPTQTPVPSATPTATATVTPTPGPPTATPTHPRKKCSKSERKRHPKRCKKVN